MTQAPTHIVIYSHDFGVHKTNRGLFTAIADSMPDAHHVLFDYSPIHEQSNTITVKPLHDQTLKLRKVINATRAEYPNAIIDLICHSQGCIVAGLLKPRDIRKIIMLTPPDDVSQEAMITQIRRNHTTTIDVATRTRLERSDGSTTVIHPEYWQGLFGIKPVKLYNNLAKFTQLRIIHARHDDVLGAQIFEDLNPTISTVTLNGNHNFEDEEARKQLLYILQKELSISQ